MGMMCHVTCSRDTSCWNILVSRETYFFLSLRMIHGMKHIHTAYKKFFDAVMLLDNF